MDFLMIMAVCILIALIVNIVLILRRGGPSGGGHIEAVLADLCEAVDELNRRVQHESRRSRDENLNRFRENREELSGALSEMTRLIAQQGADTAALQRGLLADVMDQMGQLQRKAEVSAQEARREQSDVLRSFEETFEKKTSAMNELQRTQFADMCTKQEAARRAQEEQLAAMREENAEKLEQMRRTVDEKLQRTVETRFNESFRLISDRLDQVHRGLGEMHELAAGVGDLKRVLTNVKTRGMLGEIQLGRILEEVLTPEQYLRETAVQPDSRNHVEFAVRLPGSEPGKDVLLPIDSKFPTEDYQRLMDAYEAGAPAPDTERIAARLEARILQSARDIHDKYICPPYTTDFAILFVPTEGLMAEVLRRPGLFEKLQRTYHVTVVGPSNLTAFLSSLQMGFRTLAIEKRSSEVWELLGAVKAEFGAFGDVLDKARKKLQEAANVVEKAGTRTRVIERRLRAVESLPEVTDRQEEA